MQFIDLASLILPSNKNRVMQIKNYIHLLTLCLVFFTFQPSVNAQKIAKNRNGEQIIIFPDGNWEKYDDNDPQHKAIYKSYKKQLEKESKKPKALAEKGLSETKGEKKIRLALEKVKNAEDDVELAKDRVNDAKFNRMVLEDELQELIDENGKASEISFVENKIKGSKTVETQAKKHLKIAKRELKNAKKDLIVVDPKSKTIAKTTRQKSKKVSKKKKYNQPKQTTLTAESKTFAKYDIDNDVMYHPPKPECGFLFDGMDEFLGKRRKDVNLGTFFSYTDDAMRRYLGNKDYMVCEGNLTQIEGGILLLNLHFSIATRDASRTFGGLNQGSLLTMKFIDGSKVKLVNTKDVTGQYDPLTERHTFVAQYLINAGQEKNLKKGEIDKVRVIWKTGFEDYEVYDVDFVKNQLKCLNRK